MALHKAKFKRFEELDESYQVRVTTATEKDWYWDNLDTVFIVDTSILDKKPSRLDGSELTGVLCVKPERHFIDIKLLHIDEAPCPPSA
jgi:hypothetical protein